MVLVDLSPDCTDFVRRVLDNCKNKCLLCKHSWWTMGNINFKKRNMFFTDSRQGSAHRLHRHCPYIWPPTNTEPDSHVCTCSDWWCQHRCWSTRGPCRWGRPCLTGRTSLWRSSRGARQREADRNSIHRRFGDHQRALFGRQLRRWQPRPAEKQ